MRSSISVDVNAPARRVFELVRDVEKWPELLPHYRRVAVQSRNGNRVVAQMVAYRHLGPLRIPVAWRAEQWPDDSDERDLRLNFRHVRGVTRGMRVSWHIRPDGNGSARISIVHDFERPLPLIGRPQLLPMFVDRFFTRAIAGRTLAEFKALAEGER